MPGLEGFSDKGEWDYAAGDVHGFRSWSLVVPVPNKLLPTLSCTPVLKGHWGQSWTSGVNEATCIPMNKRLHTPVPPPVEDCGCGFWAYWSCVNGSNITVRRTPDEEFQKLQKHAASIMNDKPLPQELRDEMAAVWLLCPIKDVLVTVNGIIQGFGRTIIGERGFRCGKAVIRDIALPDLINVTARELLPEVEEAVSMSLEDFTRKHLQQLGIDVPFEYPFEMLKQQYKTSRE